ncbi:sarcosine oxidase subunit gamma [Maliponia aquimaris]|uniref:Sarcosine oxidase, gamma subunit family n=1 Tax=Maliponia aquimaris TaxID=1673631 RepID=A0A238KZR6_9RHOB|nr:sarcosine oxidase subunit gamma [Maliponia aquimaris]SMX47586.1 Sarcosine oxidase, gamma subunit family [Maliponia aquimaris]
MVELKALSPCAGLLPVTRGGVTLSEVDPGRLTALMPFKGQAEALSAALTAAHGVALPAPGRVVEGEGVLCGWTGRGQVFLAGPAPDEGLARFASVTDQSDAWAVVELSGAGIEDVLARLVPIDLRPAAFSEGSAARTLCQHMTVTVWRVGPGLRVMGFRSMARTLAHEIADAMASVAGRQAAG